MNNTVLPNTVSLRNLRCSLHAVAQQNLWVVSGLACTPSYGVFRDMPNAQTSELPCIQHRYFGAAIAA
ncbi:MAG TPA: hypothetical protein VFV58_11000 [Blastocatellia bacterium]|jgi:hypothetical protein|nr:hypothetical protein [Blastocatellia bacterium]